MKGSKKRNTNCTKKVEKMQKERWKVVEKNGKSIDRRKVGNKDGRKDDKNKNQEKSKNKTYEQWWENIEHWENWKKIEK